MALREQFVEKSDWAPLTERAAALKGGAVAAAPTAWPKSRAGVFPLRQQAIKRAIDVAAAVVLLVLLAPLLLALCIAIRIDSPGPALFRQWRLGLNGKPFRIVKLRTLSVMEDGCAIVQVTKHDPRVTRLGGILRRFSLDELPQLENVLRGEMSLVGPRPHAMAHDREYAALFPDYVLRQSVRPGITGWAQIHGCRGQTATPAEMRRRVGLDLWYLAHARLRLDLKILLATPWVVLFGRNAW